ncbi:hypothetical protein BH09ACT5_BH09ACT5_04460 [soil metagenome]
MPSEKDLRDLFAGAEAPNTLDSGRVIARSRARRLPKQVAAGSDGALAVVGLVVLGVQVTQLPRPVTTAGEVLDSSAPAPEIATMKRAPAEKVNLCAGTLAETAPSQYGLQLDVVFPATAPSGAGPVTGTVRLTNTSDREVVGTTPSAPAVTLSRDGVVLWHTNGAADLSAVVVDLAPGASLEYQAAFTPVRCDVEDDLADAFRADLPALDPGAYELSALIDFTAGASMEQLTPELDLVGGPRSTITLE